MVPALNVIRRLAARRKRLQQGSYKAGEEVNCTLIMADVVDGFGVPDEKDVKHLQSAVARRRGERGGSLTVATERLFCVNSVLLLHTSWCFLSTVISPPPARPRCLRYLLKV